MAKGMVYSRKGVLQGVFTNKKNLWEDIEKTHGDVEELMMKFNPTKPTPLTYSKLVKHLGERKMLAVYLKEEIEQSAYEGTLDECPAEYKIWEVEINEHFAPSWMRDDDEDEELEEEGELEYG